MNKYQESSFFDCLMVEIVCGIDRISMYAHLLGQIFVAQIPHGSTCGYPIETPKKMRNKVQSSLSGLSHQCKYARGDE
jgi:hypothetical protein